MDLDGLWTAKFSTASGEGSGVITLGADGRMTGGDSNYFYAGWYKQDRPTVLSGKLQIVHFNGALTNLFGPVRNVVISFTAVAGDDLIMAEARPEGMPHMRMSIRLDRVISLKLGVA